MEDMKIKIFSGSASIGGNFIRIEDGDRIIIFDQGIRFDLLNKYYAGFISPRGVSELRDIGAIPKPEWYEEASAIYISHMHLDHLGALSNIPSETIVKLPSISVYEDIEEKWSTSPTWLSLIPRKYYVKLEQLQPYQTDDNDVMAIPVSHSAYPSYTFIYFGKNETVLYTGDFRIESFLEKEAFHELHQGDDLLTFLAENKDIRIDTLIIEGTNIGSERIPITPTEATKIIEKLVKNREQSLATLHWLDAEYAYLLMSIAEDAGLEVAIASASLAALLEKISKLPLEPKVIAEYTDHITTFPKTFIENMKEKTLILVSYREIVDLLKDLNSSGSLSKDCLAIMSEPEPQIEEGSEYTVIANWFSLIGVESYRIRASGHYYQYQLKNILESIKPRKGIMPIHTGKPKLFLKVLKNNKPP